MNKIKLMGLRNIELLGEDPKEEKEYAITIRAEVESVEKDIKDPKTPYFIYKMRYLSTELVNEIGAKELKVRDDMSRWTPSQIQHFAANDALIPFTQDAEEDYKKLISKSVRVLNLSSELKLNPLEVYDKFITWLEAKRV